MDKVEERNQQWHIFEPDLDCIHCVIPLTVLVVQGASTIEIQSIRVYDINETTKSFAVITTEQQGQYCDD